MTAITITDLTNAKTDVDHIAAIATSTALTATDRLGNTKQTMAGVLAQYPNAPATAAAAQTSAAASEVSRQASGTQAALSAVQAGLAATAKTQAESARDAALIQAGVYADEPTGRTAVADGAAFKVQGSGGVAALEYRRTNSTASVLIASYPSSAQLAPLLSLAPVGYSHAFPDRDGFVTVGILDDGTLKANNASVTTLATSAVVAGTISAGTVTANAIGLPSASLSVSLPAGYVHALMDQDGLVAYGVKNSGVFATKTLETETINGVPFASLLGTSTTAANLGAQNFGADINHLLSYGQSLSLGGQSRPPISTTQRFDNLKFSGGVRAQENSTDPAVKYASFQPLVETDSSAMAAGETVCSGATEMTKELIAAENGILYTQQSYQLLGSAPGFGATAIAALSKPSSAYSQLMQDVAYGYSLSQTAGKTYKVPTMFWTQGESDGGNTTYAAQLNQLRTDFTNDVQAITGQLEPVVCICYQIYRADIGLQYVLAQKTYPNISIATPTYHLTYVDNVHLTAQSSKWLGAYYGVAYKRIVIDGGTWKPTMPVSKYKQGKLAYIKFNVPKGKLVFDTTTLAARLTQGFHLFDASGSAMTITDVSIVNRDTVRITASAVIPTGAKLRYGFTDPTDHTPGPQLGNVMGGNLRDTQGDTVIFGGGGLNLPMHNWCVLFEETF